LGFSPEELRDNMRVTIDQIKKDASALTDRVNKEIYEVVSTWTVFNLELASNRALGAELDQRTRLLT
jgi:hypothetical protein